MYRYLLMLCSCFQFACHSGTMQTDLQSGNMEATAAASNSADDTLLLGEHILGPARVRAEINGQLLFMLNDNVPVSTTIPTKGWQQVGLFVNITASEFSCACIRKGSPILVKGKEVGSALEDIKIEVSKTNEGLIGELIGYTLTSNIRKSTIPEHILESIISRSPNPSRQELQPFLHKFGFASFDALMPGLQAYEIDDTWIESPSTLPRIWLIFENDKLLAVIHSRPIKVLGMKPVKLQHGLHLSMITDKDHAFVQKLMKSVTTFFQHAG